MCFIIRIRVRYLREFLSNNREVQRHNLKDKKRSLVIRRTEVGSGHRRQEHHKRDGIAPFHRMVKKIDNWIPRRSQTGQAQEQVRKI